MAALPGSSALTITADAHSAALDGVSVKDELNTTRLKMLTRTKGDAQRWMDKSKGSHDHFDVMLGPYRVAEHACALAPISPACRSWVTRTGPTLHNSLCVVAVEVAGSGIVARLAARLLVLNDRCAWPHRVPKRLRRSQLLQGRESCEHG